LRENLSQGRKEDQRKNEDTTQRESAQSTNSEKPGTGGNTRVQHEQKDDGKQPDDSTIPINNRNCIRCGRVGNKVEDCVRPLICGRCRKEGHVPRACEEVMPWECIAPFVGFAAPGQGFHVIQNEGVEESGKEMDNCALIKITKGSVTARQLESEFKAQEGPNSTWRWFAKKISENTFQMRFPTAKKVEELSFFTGMQMGTVSDVTFKVELWNPNVGAKSKLETAWFRIFGIPLEKRNDKKVSFVASLVGLPMEIDKNNLKRWEFARAKIGCRDITKVPAVVEGLLDFHFYDFVFQREVPVEGVTNATGTKWTRNSDRQKDDNPSPKKPRWATPTLVEITVDLVKLAQKCQEIKQMIMAKLQMRMQLNKIRG